jgi:nucleoside-diphosphate-sugar epimerase
MRIVVVGATGNTGTSLLPELARDPAVDAILGVARRLPELQLPKTDWAQADVESDDLTQLFRGADAVVHLAWAIQPSRDQAKLRRTNVSGSSRVFRAVADAGVGTLVYASSVGAYSRGPKDRAVDEAWPVHGIGSSFYSRHKAEVEGLLDLFERERPEIRVARLRPGLIFKREAASGVRRLFAGPFLVNPLLRPGLLPVVPRIHGLRFQAVHTRDVAAAYRLAILREDARGAYNVAADPVLDPEELGRILGARPVPVPTRLARGLTALTWRAHVQPTPPGWLDLGLGVPVMNARRAREELGWTPQLGADEALLDLLAGLRDSADAPTPPLAGEAGGPARTGEIATGVGERQG